MVIGVDIRCLMDEKYSGVAWYTYNLLTALFELDQINDYILFYNSAKSVHLPKFNSPNVRFVGRRWPNKLFNLSLFFLNRPRLDQLIGGCDIFFVPNLHFVACSSKCKKIVTVHDLSFLVDPSWFTLKQRLWHRLILKKKILQQAEIILADSNNTSRDLVELLSIPAEKIRTIYLGIDNIKYSILNINETSSVKSEILDKYHIQQPFFLFVGTIEPRKNVLGLIKAFADLNQQLENKVNLVIAGERGWKVKIMTNDPARLATRSVAGRQLPMTNENSNRIKFLGYVPEEDKPALYQSAIALVYPSYYEGFGLPILEAMANGCPVICGNNSSQGEVLGDCGLLVNSDNINEISRAMELMLINENLRQDFIRRGQERAKEFTWQKTAEQVLEIFKQIK